MPTVILDANLLVLLVVGLTAREYIAKHKRLQAYTVADFDLLTRQISGFTKVVVTPNTLTEASNLAAQIREPARSAILETFRRFLQLPTSDEQYIESRKASAEEMFIRLGLTDSVLLDVSSATATVLLTADLDLYLAAKSAGREALNFHHLREL